MTRKIIITGSEGLVGKELCNFFKNESIFKLDIKLGHDLTNETFVKKWFKKNHADYLVNCFAMNDHITKTRKKNTLFDISLNSFSKYLEVNLTSLFSVCREFARNNNKGAIVNFSSTYGIVSPKPDLYSGSNKDIGYGISKAGVINMTKYLAAHLSPKIRVNCVVPGWIITERQKKLWLTPEIEKQQLERQCIKRMLEPNDIAKPVLFFASDQSLGCTAQNYVVDGGVVN